MASLGAIRRRLRELGNAEAAEHAQRFFKTGKGEYGEGDRFIGVRMPVIRALAKELRDIPIARCSALLRDPIHEARLLALIILTLQYKHGTKEMQKQIYTEYLASTTYVNNWDLVDASAHLILGPYLESRPRKPLYQLVRSKNLWERRIAIMATFHFIRGEDFSDTLALAEQVLADPEDLIHKVSGWMLREVGNRDLEALRGFLEQHVQAMPRTMLRYAIEKLPKPERQRWLKA